MQLADTIYVAGGDTLVGAAILRQLRARGFERVLGDSPDTPDVTVPGDVDWLFRREQPDFVFHAAGPAAGIGGNQRAPADLCVENMAANGALMTAAHRYRARRLLCLASSCCYPRDCPQPASPERLWSGPLEPTSAAYAAAKLAGIALCQAYRRQYGCDFIAAIPANPFGIGDDFDEEHGHVIGSLMAKMHAAKVQERDEVVVWGTGKPVREFIFADDLADACLFVMQHPEPPVVLNIGSGQSASIADLARLIADVVGFAGNIAFDASCPDGAPRKELDSRPLRAMGWRPPTALRDALARTYAWYCSMIEHQEVASARS
ncbi:MAG: NAD-dependent epimerase/dehydratase family protein [Planctomycetia bacterium]|nr:NAD-dependent epimerase/dehydratase family protein [Planctomycetia bacterium]